MKKTMKLIYHLNSTYNPGGMERVTLNKVRWWVEKGHEMLVVTTDQKGREPFFPFPEGVRLVDLGINYHDDVGLGVLKQTLNFFRKRRLHKKRLTALLMAEKADITVSLYPGESSFIPGIRDGSRKVLELHQGRYFHRQYANCGLKGLADRIREWADGAMVRRFDRFVVLTGEDLANWGKVPNILAIPNAATLTGARSDCSAHRVIAVGRLDFQKGFDRLIKAWKPYKDWTLEIFGQGEWEPVLRAMIAERGLESSVHINAPVKDIRSEYTRSSILVMSSHYEGFPMAMVEGMTCGLPAVSFDFQCGPRDMIEDGVNGLLVRNGDLEGLGAALTALMSDDAKRARMGREAAKVAERYSEEKVMKQWEDCFRSILS